VGGAQVVPAKVIQVQAKVVEMGAPVYRRAAVVGTLREMIVVAPLQLTNLSARTMAKKEACEKAFRSLVVSHSRT
jgi:hypothetical protein